MHRLVPSLILAVVVAVAGCHKKPEKPKSSKKKREDAIAQASEEQAALDKFTAAVREALQWYQSQPAAPTAAERQKMVAELAQRMEKIPVAGLADDLAKAWTPMLKAWQQLAKTSDPDTALREQGAKASAELNRQLAARGVMDIRF